jgi:hypothetical protein
VCQKPLRGRTDKVFCSVGCKNDYHKNIRFAAKKAAIEINGYLKRNYAILSEVLGNNLTQIKVHRNVLEKKKFRFKYHTHTHVNSKGKTFHYVYDFAWMEFSDDEILVVRAR